MSTKKIGAAVITCNREHLFQRCLNSVAACEPDVLIVVNDGATLSENIDLKNAHLIQHAANQGVAKSKNDAFKYLIAQGCDYIYIIEDDIELLYETTLLVYLEYSMTTKLHHMIYGYHGPANKDAYGTPRPRFIAEHRDDLKLAFNRHCVGAFCLYTKECLETVGLINEDYNNAFDHVEHSYRISKAGMCTPYWWWPDVANSWQYIADCDSTLQNSVIRKDSGMQVNIRESMELFNKTHGHTPISVPDTTQGEVIKYIKSLAK